MVGALAQRLPGLANTMLPAAMNLLQTVVGAITDNIGPITELATSLVTSLAGFLVDNLPQLADAAVQLVSGLLDGIIAALPELIPAGIEAIVHLATGLVQGIPQLIAKLPEIVTAIWNGIVATDWAQLGKDILGSITSGLASIGQTIMDLLGVPEGTQDTVITAWNTFAGAISDGVQGVLGAVTTFLGSLFNPPAEGDQTTIGGCGIPLREPSATVCKACWGP